MKKSWVKVLTIVTAISMAGGFAGCGKSKDSTAANSAVSQESAVQGENNEGNQDGNQQQDDGKAMGRVTAVGDSSITVSVMQGRGGGPGGNGEKPDGEAADGEMPEKPDGEAADGEMPEKPDGEAADGEMPEKPDGEAADGEMPEKPDGEAADGEMPVKPDGEAPNGEMPEGETKEIKVDDATTYTKITEDNNTETITLADITEGQMVTITYAEDGETAASIEVREMNMKQPQGEKQDTQETKENE